MRGFGGGMGGLMAQAQKMQAKIAKVQEEIAAMEVAGESGGGAVKVVITGKHECKSVVIDPDPTRLQQRADPSLRNLRGAHAQGSSASSGYEAAVLISLTRSER